jgi:hypothetical protein
MDATKANHEWPLGEIVNQVRITRATAGVSGQAYWNMKALMHNRALDDALQREVYQLPALSPVLTWVHAERPAKPAISVARVPRRVSWKPGLKEELRLWVFQTRHGAVWTTRLLPRNECSFSLARDRPEVIALSVIDRYGNASPPAVVELNEREK